MILLSRHLTPCICTKKHLLFPLLLLFFPCCLMLRAFTVPLQPVLQPPLLAQLAAPSTAAMLGSWQHLLWEPGTYLEVARERAPAMDGVLFPAKRGQPEPGGNAAVSAPDPYQHKSEDDLVEEIPMCGWLHTAPAVMPTLTPPVSPPLLLFKQPFLSHTRFLPSLTRS